MEPTRKLRSTQSYGIIRGTDFNGGPLVPDIGNAAITKIVIGHTDFIHSLTVHYDTHAETRRGGPEHPQTEVVLSPGEFITALHGRHIGDALGSIRLESNKGGKWGPYGNAGVQSELAFEWKAPGEGMGLLFFSGKADATYIWSLTAIWANYPVRDELTLSAADDGV